jgi:hypothetical protein
MARRSCSGARTKATDDAEAEAGQGEEETAEGKQGERSMAYQVFAGIYVCVLVFSWRTGQLITVNAQDAIERLRRYVLEKFSRKH